METITIKINKRSKAGSALLELVKILSESNQGIELISQVPAEKTGNKTKIPNAETIMTFERTNKEIDLTKTKNHSDLMDKLFS